MKKHPKPELTKKALALVKWNIPEADLSRYSRWPLPNVEVRNALKLKRRENYTPEDPSTLVKPVLLTHFKRWSGNRYPKIQSKSNVAHGQFKNHLEDNIYARILSSRPRMEIVSRAILPSDLMIKVGVVQRPCSNDDLTPEILLTQLLRKSSGVVGKKAYALCKRETIEILDTRHKSILSAISSSSKDAIQSSNELLRSAQWRKDAPNFGLKLLEIDIMESAKVLIDELKSSSTQLIENSYSITWSIDESQADVHAPTKSIQINQLLPSEVSEKLKCILLCETTKSKKLWIDDFTLKVPKSSSSDLGITIWKYSLYNMKFS